MNFFKTLERLEKKAIEDSKKQKKALEQYEKELKQEERKRIKEGIEGKYQDQRTYIVVGFLIVFAILIVVDNSPAKQGISIGIYLQYVFLGALALCIFTFVRSWMYYHRHFSSSSISKWRREKTLFSKKLRYSSIRGGIVLVGSFIILFVLYFF